MMMVFKWAAEKGLLPAPWAAWIPSILLVLLGVSEADEDGDADFLSEKIPHLRVFEDDAGKMNLALSDVGGAVLAVSQFTLYADTRKGRRPSFVDAARPEQAEPLYEHFCRLLAAAGVTVAKRQIL
jgi:D-tyrosyl-tRNA(Tyr) deacylase